MLHIYRTWIRPPAQAPRADPALPAAPQAWAVCPIAAWQLAAMRLLPLR